MNFTNNNKIHILMSQFLIDKALWNTQQMKVSNNRKYKSKKKMRDS